MHSSIPLFMILVINTFVPSRVKTSSSLRSPLTSLLCSKPHFHINIFCYPRHRKWLIMVAVVVTREVFSSRLIFIQHLINLILNIINFKFRSKSLTFSQYFLNIFIICSNTILFFIRHFILWFYCR